MGVSDRSRKDRHEDARGFVVADTFKKLWSFSLRSGHGLQIKLVFRVFCLQNEAVLWAGYFQRVSDFKS